MSSDPALTLARWFSADTQHTRADSAIIRSLKWAIESGDLKTTDDLVLWIETMLSDGYGYHDSLYLTSANEAMSQPELDALNGLCEAYCNHSGRADELADQGAEFFRILQANHGIKLKSYAYPVAVGKAAALCEIPLDMTARFYLRSLAIRIIKAAADIMQLDDDEVRDVLIRLLIYCGTLSKVNLNPMNRNLAPTLFD